MVVVKLNYRFMETVGSLLMYLEGHFSEKQIPHKKMLYGYLDKWENLCSEHKQENIHRPVYCLDPFTPEYKFMWRKNSFVLRIENIGSDHLYTNVQNVKNFEPVFVIEIQTDGDDPSPIDELLCVALEKSSRWNIVQTSNKEIVVYHWVDTYWEKLSVLEKREMDTMYLPEKERENIIFDLKTFFSEETKKIYAGFGIPYHRTYCFHGPPGTGKSSLIFSLVSMFDKNIGVLSLSKKTDDQSFVRAVSSITKNTVLLLEDIDCLLSDREDKDTQITFSSILNCIDGIQSKQGLVIFITTNYIKKLDPAFCRPGRIDYILKFNYINRSQVFQMLNKFFPEQSDRFEGFYRYIKDLKITTCILQKYLFYRYPNKDIMENIEEIKKDAEFSRFDNDGKMYL